MSNHDYVISNGTGAAVRSDINSVLQAIVGLNAGASAPSTTFPNMLWYDTANGILWKRTNADDAWEQILVGKATESDGNTGTDDAKGVTVARVLAMIKKHKTRVGSLSIVTGELDINAALYDVVNVTANANFELQIPTNGEDGDRIEIRITQDGTGSRVLTLAEGFLIASELAEDGIVLSTAAGAIDKIGMSFNGSNWMIDAFSTDYAEEA